MTTLANCLAPFRCPKCLGEMLDQAKAAPGGRQPTKRYVCLDLGRCGHEMTAMEGAMWQEFQKPDRVVMGERFARDD